MKFLRNRIFVFLILFIVILSLNGCADDTIPVSGTSTEDQLLAAKSDAIGAPIPTPLSTPNPTPEPTPEPTPQPRVTLMALGDDLLHNGIVKEGKQADGSYNYDFLFNGLTDLIETADISVINQETILGGSEFPFQGYPTFNSPNEVGDAIIKAGFDVVLHATNHTLDQGEKGLNNCIAYWKSHPEILMVGIHEPYGTTESEDGSVIPSSPKDHVQLLTKNGITFAILNYSYGTNLATVPAYARDKMNMLCYYDPSSGKLDFTKMREEVLEDIAAADEMADIVIVFPHWGVEYVTDPTIYEKQFAQQMTQAGADLIIGTHPHVTQPVQWIEADNGNKALCYYSLGNYVSTQKDPITMLENMAWVTFLRTEDGVIIDSEGTGSIPIVCHYVYNPLRLERVYLLEEYSQELADKHGILPWGGQKLNYQDLKKWSKEILGDSVKSVYELTGLREKNLQKTEEDETAQEISVPETENPESVSEEPQSASEGSESSSEDEIRPADELEPVG